MGKHHFYQLSTNKTVVCAKPAGPKSWGSEEHLSSQTVEDSFAKIESKLAQLHEKMKGETDLTMDERYGWSMWLLASYLRTPAAFLSILRQFSIEAKTPAISKSSPSGP